MGAAGSRFVTLVTLTAGTVMFGGRSSTSSSNFGQTQQHNMSDIVTALGPGRKLDSLSSFAPTYVTACRALDNLLVFPNLDAIKIDDTSESNLLSLGSVGF